jgi:hypothetical protein
VKWGSPLRKVSGYAVGSARPVAGVLQLHCGTRDRFAALRPVNGWCGVRRGAVWWTAAVEAAVPDAGPASGAPSERATERCNAPALLALNLRMI